MAYEPRFNSDLQRTPVRLFHGLRSRYHYPDPRLVPGYTNDGFNINFGERGFGSKRNGYDKYNSNNPYTSSTTITGFTEANIGSYGEKRVIVTPKKIYSDDGSSQVDITGSVSLTGGNDDHTRFAVIQDTLCATNGKEMWTWNGNDSIPTNAKDFTFSTGDGLTSFSSCVDFVEHKNVLVAMAPTESGTKYQSRIRWSDIDILTFNGDITNWRTDNRAEIGEGGSPIIGGVDNWDKLWIFKSDGCYYGSIFYDNGFLSYRQEGVLKGFHPIATHSFYARPEFICGIAYEGLFIIKPDGSFEIATLDIQDIWNSLNRDRLQYAIVAPREKDHQIRSLISSSTNTVGHNRVLSWDWETGDITITRYTDVLNHIGHYYVSGVEYDFLGIYEGLNNFRGNIDGTHEDDSTPFTYRLITVPDDCGAPGLSKTIKNIILYYSNTSGTQSVTLQCYRDQGIRASKTVSKDIGQELTYDSGLTYNSGLSYGGGANHKLIYSINRTAENIQLDITGTGTISLIGYQIEFFIDDNNEV